MWTGSVRPDLEYRVFFERTDWFFFYDIQTNIDDALFFY